MFQFVETQKQTYLCSSVTEEGTKLVLKDAMAVKDRQVEPDVMARTYIRARLMEKLRTINVSTRSLESQEDAEEVSPLITLMEQYIPIAEKKARARIVMQEVTKLANIDNDNDIED